MTIVRRSRIDAVSASATSATAITSSIPGGARSTNLRKAPGRTNLDRAARDALERLVDRFEILRPKAGPGPQPLDFAHAQVLRRTVRSGSAIARRRARTRRPASAPDRSIAAGHAGLDDWQQIAARRGRAGGFPDATLTAEENPPDSRPIPRQAACLLPRRGPCREGVKPVSHGYGAHSMLERR